MKAAVRSATVCASVLLLIALVWAQADLFVPAQIALSVFIVTAALWTFTRLNPGWVALVVVMALAAAGATREALVFAMLGHDVIWLMIGAFVMGAAIERTGLAARIAAAVARRARTARQLFWYTTWLLIPFTFLVPSTSGRAATMLPLLRIVPEQTGGALRRAYALLIPVVILLATSAALTGAGSHLVLEELLVQRLGDRFGFGMWALWGVPFAAAASALACAAIMRMFLTPEERALPLNAVSGGALPPLSPEERRTIAIVSLTLLLWLTSAWHGFGIATVAIVAMLALTAPMLGVLSFKDGAKAVNWPLILFVGAAMLLGRTLIDTQAASWAMNAAFEGLGLQAANGARQVLSEWFVIAAISALAMVSHLLITSHVARAAALGPPLLLFAQTAGVDPIAVLFIGAVGMNYCITLPVCSKALMVFQDDGTGGFTPGDLARLSLILALPHFALMVAMYFGWWKWTGLSLI